MERLRPKSLFLALTLIGVLLAALRLTPLAVANGERVTALAALTNSTASGSIDEQAWDAGWRSLCRPGTADDPEAASLAAAGFIARGLVDRGDYAGALAEFRQAAGSQDAAEARLASAYAAALELRWLDAAQLYPGQPTARHQRFWGTIFYLAAQELMFRGESDEAAAWYRRADQSYDVQGPYLGLELMECLAQQGRTLEAFDAYRRGLVVLPPEEALAQRERFEQMRLDALRQWQEQDPENAQVTAWLDFYTADRRSEEQETLTSPPQPKTPFTYDLDDGRRLIGFDYRPEDIATGPFMWVDLYVQQGMAEGDPVVRLRRAVLNQAPNGSFAWDAAPDGVRPFGWHVPLYSDKFEGVEYDSGASSERWLCVNGGKLNWAFGLQSLPARAVSQEPGYIQSGSVYFTGKTHLGFGRYWFEDPSTADPHSNIHGTYSPGNAFMIQGFWKPDTHVEHVAVWFYSGDATRACAKEVILFYPANTISTEAPIGG